jgi:hypothetical protein
MELGPAKLRAATTNQSPLRGMGVDLRSRQARRYRDLFAIGSKVSGGGQPDAERATAIWAWVKLAYALESGALDENLVGLSQECRHAYRRLQQYRRGPIKAEASAESMSHAAAMARANHGG